MEPAQLHNQLRFNLEQPYSINKLSVRHKRPKPFTIEKFGAAGSPPNGPMYPNTEQVEKELMTKFSTLSVDRMKEAQFLAKRQLKKEKDNVMGERRRPPDATQHAKRVPSEKVINKQPLKVTSSKGLQRLPAAGDSPPVRDSSTIRVRPKSVGARRYLNKQLSSPQKAKGIKTSQDNLQTTSVYHNGILQEKLINPEYSFSMPNLHKMAMDQLLQVQRGDVPSRTIVKTSPKKTKASNRKAPASKPGSPCKIQFVRPSARAKAARKLREKIYRQPLTRPSPYKPSLAYQSPKTPKRRGRGRVLPRHHTTSQYDPDYDYINPEAVLKTSQRHALSTPKSKELPNADEFIHRIVEARKANETAERYPIDYNKILEEIEREARLRLEPMIQHAERVSEDVKKALSTSHKSSRVYTANPQYNGGHEGQDMSADDLLHHPVDSCIGQPSNPQPKYSNQARYSAMPSHGPQAMLSTLSGDAPVFTHPDEDTVPLSDENLSRLQNMLTRLDEMQKEQVEIRQRWLSTSNRYSTQGILALNKSSAAQHNNSTERVALHEEPPFLLLKKSKARDAQSMDSANIRNSQKSTIYSSPLKSSVQIPDAPYREVALSLPTGKLKSTEEGRKRFQKHLASISHTPSAGFDPWKFAEQTADEIVDQCLSEIAVEFIEAGDSLIQGLYADEFVAVKHSPPSPTAPPT